MTMTRESELKILRDSLTRWKLPDCYMGETYEDYFVGLSQHRDSDSLSRSNFESALEDLGGESDTVFVVRAGHWAVGWIEWIAIHEDDLEALRIQYEIEGALADYPVLNEEHHSELEMEEASRVWDQCYSDNDRIEYIRDHRNQFYFNDWSDLRAVVRGEYFTGYASELIS